MTRISQDELLGMLADELDAARAQLEALGVALIGDSNVAMHHIGRLQAIDHIGQRCASIAAILRSDDLHAASVNATLESVPARLEAWVEHGRGSSKATATPIPSCGTS
jgi:hypothetical protein